MVKFAAFAASLSISAGGFSTADHYHGLTIFTATVCASPLFNEEMFEFEERSSSSSTLNSSSAGFNFSMITEAVHFNPWIIHPKCEATCGSFTTLSVSLSSRCSFHHNSLRCAL
jgi:hypothetical protein